MEILQSITTADWINIFIACVTLLTAIIALLTINEMRTQRVHSYFPDLNMADFSFYIYRGDYDQQTETVFLYTFRDRKEENTSISGFNELKIGIDNIGFGVAKNVKWNWYFNIEDAKKIICRDSDVNWEENDDFIIIDSLPLNISWALDIEEDNRGGSFNFILPYVNENRETEIVIPDYFINLYWLFMVNQISTENHRGLNEHEFPQLELNVNYTDIHSNVLSKTFLIAIKFDMIALPREESNELAKFRFEISEKY
ncbi:hypothetical protein ASE21_14950 [Flavobacterium sp. Root901]|uniref:hypothetical protein n=1 Tax=Flavobacterium sp. Root901 TaxID=1736605 RepID=UPI000708CBC3|nr:hypothetical protein [Flavobacterium sp. Root901]KRD09143.1 hypothetical protein ASE21_14950 [Flavobacterium sp. Root901]